MLLHHSSFIALALIQISVSSALAQTTETVGWQSDPNGRGTFTLVSSCIFTLTICVYSAMHLNVPPRKESAIQFWLRNIKWGLLGIFGPELVVFIAWKQYLSAKSIVRRAQSDPRGNSDRRNHERLKAKKDNDPESCEHLSNDNDFSPPWTIVHGFYAGMGGFTIKLSNPSASSATPVYKTAYKYLTLTARGVALLADCGLLPEIERKTIDDKSKSDGLSKSIACVQAAWLIVQVIGRLSLGLQVTLLEINTLGHVFCALVIYVLWWHKPRMVLEPMTLTGEWVDSLCAYMYMSSCVSSDPGRGGINNPDLVSKPEMSRIVFFPDGDCERANHNLEGCNSVTALDTSSRAISRTEPGTVQGAYSLGNRSPTEQKAPFEFTSGGCFKPRPSNAQLHKGSPKYGCLSPSDDLDAGQTSRWALGAEALSKYPAIKRRFTPVQHTDISGRPLTYLQESQPEELVVDECSNWSTRGLLQGDYGLIMGMALWFASMAFGGIHAAAWYDYFPTSIESWLWRCSAVYITWAGLVWLLINLAAHVSKPFDDYWNQLRMPQPPFANSIPIVGLSIVCGTLYTFARMYLVIEAFISIRKLPVSAYRTPEWMELIPHL